MNAPPADALGLALLGAGTVGQGVLRLLAERGAALARAAGRPLVVRGVLVRDGARARPGVDPALVTTDGEALIDRSDVALVVEVMGGTDRAVALMARALAAGKGVVTANKAALAECGPVLLAQAAAGGAPLRYEAAVAGGIPVIRAFEDGLVSNRVPLVVGILNGTCNYLLTRMEEDGAPFDEVLAEAQRKGFAEADPTLDVSGRDAAHKLALLFHLVTRALVPQTAVFVEGIEGIGPADLAHARAAGRRVRLLGIAQRRAAGYELRVHPAMIPERFLLAHVRDEMNAVYLKGDAVGPMLFYGRGAGALPTASAVLSDVVDLARRPRPGPPIAAAAPPAILPMDELVCRHYLRLAVADEPGVLGQLAQVLGARGVSIATLHQDAGAPGRTVGIRLTTHPARERAVRECGAEFVRRGLVRAPVTRIRLEDFEDDEDAL